MTVSSPKSPIVNPNGEPSRRLVVWFDQVSDLSPKSGIGPPEDVVAGVKDAQYFDDAAATGSIHYYKRFANIGGDPTKGWIVV